MLLEREEVFGDHNHVIFYCALLFGLHRFMKIGPQGTLLLSMAVGALFRSLVSTCDRCQNHSKQSFSTYLIILRG
jgi:hypothetical protein